MKTVAVFFCFVLAFLGITYAQVTLLPLRSLDINVPVTLYYAPGIAAAAMCFIVLNGLWRVESNTLAELIKGHYLILRLVAALFLYGISCCTVYWYRNLKIDYLPMTSENSRLILKKREELEKQLGFRIIIQSNANGNRALFPANKGNIERVRNALSNYSGHH